jgi:hypothetical protein
MARSGGPDRSQEAVEAARGALHRYAKGKRMAAIADLESVHASTPSHFSCLAMAKVWIMEAVAAAVKVRALPPPLPWRPTAAASCLPLLPAAQHGTPLH